jgi:anti-sigma factor RsiW
MTAEGCREWRERLGALVLGMLGADEHAAVAAHLEGCPACRAETEALAPLARLLPLADPRRLGPAPAPPARLRSRIEQAIGAERRLARRRRGLRFGLALAGAACLALAVVLIAGSTGAGEHAPEREVAFRALPPGVHVGARLEDHAWGSQVAVYVEGIRRGTVCRVYVQRADGSRVSAGSFRYRYEGAEGPVLSSALSAGDAVAVTIRAGRRTFVGRVGPPES